MEKKSFNLLITLLVIGIFIQLFTIFVIVDDTNRQVDKIRVSTDNIYNYCLE